MLYEKSISAAVDNETLDSRILLLQKHKNELHLICIGCMRRTLQYTTIYAYDLLVRVGISDIYLRIKYIFIMITYNKLYNNNFLPNVTIVLHIYIGI